MRKIIIMAVRVVEFLNGGYKKGKMKKKLRKIPMLFDVEN